MRHDTQIIQSFLRGHNEAYGTALSLRGIPDDGGRRSGIDGLAGDARGRSWAIEHTLLEPFWGEQDDTRAFLKVFASFEMDPTLYVPGYQFHLAPNVGAIPKGINWDHVGLRIRAWLYANLERIPEGVANYPVPSLPVPISVAIDKSPSERPRLTVGRKGLPDTRELVIQKALSRKLSKLINTSADQHVLIFEKADLYTGYVGITTAIDAFAARFPQLGSLDHIWVAQSSFAQTDDTVFFLRVWPDGVTAKFKSGWRAATLRQGTASAVPLGLAKEGGFSR